MTAQWYSPGNYDTDVKPSNAEIGMDSLELFNGRACSEILFIDKFLFS